MGIINRLKGRAVAVAICAGVLAAGAGTGTVMLASNSVRATVDPSNPANAKPQANHGPAKRVLANLEQLALKTAAQQLNLTEKQLRQQLPGKSLAQVAGDKAQSVQDAIFAAAKQKLDTQVTAGKLKSDQETKLLSALQERLPKLMSRVFPAKHAPPSHNHKLPGGSPRASPSVSPFADTSAV